MKSAIINDYSVTAELEIPDGPDAGEVLENAKNTLLSPIPGWQTGLMAWCRCPPFTPHCNRPVWLGLFCPAPG